MAEFGSSLDKSLGILFQYSKVFNLSIELVQKLSQQLKLDTFVDTDAYSHTIDQPLKDEEGNIIKFQRLSIAGSLILIEFDFVDSTIYRVSFSSASQLEDKKFDKQVKPLNIVQNGNINTIKVHFDTDLNDSIISKSSDNNIEGILLASLKHEKLHTFPQNLEYLANLDRLSTSEIDLFNYLDNLSMVLQTISHVEATTTGENDWLMLEGYKSILGKLSNNKPLTNQVGIFLDFWKDFRFINHEYHQNYTANKLLAGNEYSLLLQLDTENYSTSIDYLADVRDHVWEVNGVNYQIQFSDDSHLSSGRSSAGATGAASNGSSDKGSKFASNWNISWQLNHGIFVPVNLLEFIGIDHFDEDPHPENGFFDVLNDDNRLLLKMKDQDYKISIKNETHSKFVCIKSVMVKKLTDLPLFIKIFRNHIVLSNILSQLINNHCNTIDSEDEVQVDWKIKDKLKDSLQLVDDKVLSLQALNRDKIADDEFMDLDEFMKETSAPYEAEPENLCISISDIAFGQPNFDISVSVKGDYKGHSLDSQFNISNGEVVHHTTDDSMNDTDETSPQQRFSRALNVTEDILESLDHSYT